MDDSQKQDFAITIGAMCETFAVESTKPLMLGYWMGLCDLELKDVQEAVKRAIRECTTMPKPAQLRQLTGKVFDPETMAMLAWHDALKSLRLGKYKHVDFDDKLINAVIRNMGGWPSFCSRFTDAGAEKWVRQEFVTCYKRFAGSSVGAEAIAALPGLSEVSVVDGKLEPCQAVRIACDDSRKALPCPVIQPRAGSFGLELKRVELLESK